MVSSIRGGKNWPWREVDNEAGFSCLAQMGCWRENRGPRVHGNSNARAAKGHSGSSRQGTSKTGAGPTSIVRDTMA